MAEFFVIGEQRELSVGEAGRRRLVNSTRRGLSGAAFLGDRLAADQLALDFAGRENALLPFQRVLEH